MIKSMTAFAGCETQLSSLNVYCELRSVNHRYCEVSLKLPEKWRFMESGLRTAISVHIKRGKIECSFAYKNAHSSNHFSVNLVAVADLLRCTAEIEGLMTAPRSFSALEILQFPGIQQQADVDEQQLQETIEKLLSQSLQQLIAVREREGQAMQLLLEERCQKMLELVGMAKLRMPQVLLLMRQKMAERVCELVAMPDFDRLEQELVLMTQKLDVAEELERLETHIYEMLRCLTQQEPVGRRLDFLMQEMHREANTLGAKSADKEMTQISIELKVFIEQMREQIQNIE